MGRQSAARRHRADSPAGAALRRPHRAAAAPGRRRQPRRPGAERLRPGGAGAPPRRAATAGRPPGGGEAPRSAAGRLRGAARGRRVPGLHRRHGGTLRRRRLRHLPRRRLDGGRTRGGGRRRADRPAARSDRRRAERQCPVPRRRGRGDRAAAGGTHAGETRRTAREPRSRPARGDGPCGARARPPRRDAARRRRLHRRRIEAMKHKVKRIHFVGIGGAGMSGIAEVLATQGYQVSGSDLAASAVTRRLAGLGIAIHIGHAAAHVAGTDAVVVSTAVAADNPEVVAARAAGVPVVPRALMLAELMRLKQGIAIAGTHGKTTTTSLIASVLAEGGLDPTFVIGGRLLSAGANARLGKGDFLVAEADESDASFLYLQPVLAVITNIDADHMETYDHDFGKLKRAFVDFAQRLPFYGVVVVCSDDGNLREILPAITKPIVTYGLGEGAQLRAVEVANIGGRMRFIARAAQYEDLALELNLPGIHNVQNALAAIAVGREVGVPDAAIAKALSEFHGVGRRFQRYGEVKLASGGSCTLIDDYGHHPVEMAATIAAARGSFPGRRLVLAFQPHRYTRTRDLFEDFVRVLSTVDALVLADVYPAGEAPLVAADGRALARALRVAGKVEPVFVESVGDVPSALQALLRDGDVVVTMGAGSIGQVPALLAADVP
ncbi:MAG: UDP-N-acetylmuramate--L-alanine ligase [Betaproteobacteria bacterium]|nr:UDP-N-acetylmuramate--L-alanine ligase [Betaproteobacteria bacterium]